MMKKLGKLLLKGAILYTFAMYVAAYSIVQEKRKTEAEIDALTKQYEASQAGFKKTLKQLGAI